VGTVRRSVRAHAAIGLPASVLAATMTDDMRNGVKAIVVASLLGLGAAGCGGGGSNEVTERLWVSAIPTKHTQQISAFVTARSGSEYFGAFFRGSLLRGSHDAFKWRDDGKGRAKLELLQDGQKLNLRFKACDPIKPFDRCIEVETDQTGSQKYYSRKRWVVRRPLKKRDLATSGIFGATMLELAEEDDELAEALDAAGEAALAESEEPIVE
jgi:hypothetical protein